MAGSTFAAKGQPAQPLLGVVELFTSQGCNSCPPADAVLGSLAQRGDIIALAFHIDYWDYLGWHDTMASPQFTARQYAYRGALGTSNVYTPQAVLNGRMDANGAEGDTILDDLKAMRGEGKGLAVPVRLDESEAGKLKIDVGAGERPSGPVSLVLVFFDPRTDVNIGRGENGGRTIAYFNAVRDVETIGMWDGKPLHVEMPDSMFAQKRAGGCAVLLQETPDGEPGPILGAALMTEKKD